MASVSVSARLKVLGSTLFPRDNHLTTSIVPVYVSELAPPSKRGRVVGSQQWAITWGILIMFYISYGCSYINGAAAFRVPWGLQMIPAIILFFALFLLPESPRSALLPASLSYAALADLLLDGWLVKIAGKSATVFWHWSTPRAIAMHHSFCSSLMRLRICASLSAIMLTFRTSSCSSQR